MELSEFLTSLAIKNFTISSSLPKLQNYKIIVVVVATLIVQQQQLVLRLIVKATIVNGIFYMGLGAYEANGNASEMEIQKWGIKARTSRLNVIVLPYDYHHNTTITTTICASNWYMGGELVASTTTKIQYTKTWFS